MELYWPFLLPGLAVLVLGDPAGAAQGEEPSREQRAFRIGVQAYIYAYPLVLMDVTRRVATNVPAPTGKGRAPLNQLDHARAFPTPDYKDVVRPNADTLYSTAWLDLAKEPILLAVPDTNGRYYLLSLHDAWTDVFAVPGSRTTGTKAGRFALVGPHWKGQLPAGLEPIPAPTNLVWVFGRIYTRGKADYPKVHRLQDGFKLTPLSKWGKDDRPTPPAVDAAIDMKTPPVDQVNRMSARAFFETFARLLHDNPPHAHDWPILVQMKQLGIVPGKNLDFAKLDPEIRQGLERAVRRVQLAIAFKGNRQFGPEENGWVIRRELMGTFGTAYLARMAVALIGLGVNLPEDAVYPFNVADSDGQPLHGKNCYLIHFDKGRAPPVNALWSITLYDARGFFVANPLGRHAIGDRDKLKFNNDGSLDLYFQHESPGKEMESNWLPAPQAAFNLTMRMYWPKMEVLDGRWKPPPVKRVVPR